MKSRRCPVCNHPIEAHQEEAAAERVLRQLKHFFNTITVREGFFPLADKRQQKEDSK